MSIRAHVVGIDVSRASLEHEEFLKQKHNLANLTLHQMRIEEVATLGKDFDFIDCHGVLHHLVDPVAGLRALGQVLRTDGVIAVMVYGKYGRIGVDVLQELFRAMGLEQDPAGVRVVKDTLAALPPNHPVQIHRRNAPRDMASDEGLVDTFLHRRERTFSAGDCLDLAQAAGLVFQGWTENGLYHPDARLAPNHPLWAHLRKLKERDLWQTVEMLNATIGTHFFHVCRPDRNPASYVIEFADDAFLDYVPIARITQMTPPDVAHNKPALISRPPLPPFTLGRQQAEIFRLTNGICTVRECLAEARLPDSPATTTLARDLFSGLWRVGYVLFHINITA